MEYLVLDVPRCRVRLARNTRARRFILRPDPLGGGAILTLPSGVRTSEARDFLDRHSGWLDRALARYPDPVHVTCGTALPVAGEAVRVMARPGPRRAPLLKNGVLLVQGAAAPGPRIAAWLKLRARDALSAASERYAGRVSRRIAGIALRDPRSRWGSCSSAGRLSFSWRLAMAPPPVLDYVAAHEVAHLVELNHSPAFWTVVGQLLPGWRAQRAWLRQHGRELHSYRFDAQQAPASDS